MATLLAIIFAILGLGSSPPASPAQVQAKPPRCESSFAIFCPARPPWPDGPKP